MSETGFLAKILHISILEGVINFYPTPTLPELAGRE
jgi:hypothetical protein